MSIARIKLDEKSTLEFGVEITGADGKPDARFVIEGKDFSVSFPAKQTQSGVEVEIQGLASIFKAGEYAARLEVVLENKIYTPLVDKIEFEPSVSISTNSKVAKPIKESVKVGVVSVKKPVINEDQLRRTQAATIIAQSLNYTPEANATPKQIIDAALSQSHNLTNEQIQTVQDMLALAEDVGIDYNKDLSPSIIVEEEEEDQPHVAAPEDDGWSDEDIDSLANSVNDWEDIASSYEKGELHIVDDETGEHVADLDDELSEETLNEILSRVERIRAKLRFHKSEGKRERKLKVALSKHSNNAQINARARHMAIKTMKMKLAKKPLENLSVAEKERIEGIIAKRGAVVNRLAMKMTHRVRQIEKDRLTHKSTT
jgi:hypothetical protein